MKAYRIYYLENNEKKYLCETPSYGAHHCTDPEYALPFLEIEEAQKQAKLNETYVCPTGIKRHIEEYEENRLLVRHKFENDVKLAEFKRYFCEKYCYQEIIAN